MAHGDGDGFAAEFHSDAVLETTGSSAVAGKKPLERVLKEVGALKLLFPQGMILKVEQLIAEGDRVVCEVRGQNTTPDHLEYNNRYVFILEFDGAKIRELREYQDTALLERVLMPAFSRLGYQG